MQKRDLFNIPVFGIEPCKGTVQVKGFIHSFLHKGLHGAFTKKRKKIAVESTAKTLDARKTHISQHNGFSIQHMNPGLDENLANELMPAFFVIMVAEYSYHRD